MAQSLVLPAGTAAANTDQGSIYFVGTATVIIRFAGFTILTDPNFLHKGDHVHLGYGLTSMRRTNPAMEIEDLPQLDLVVLSHFHDDHFDRVAAEKLDKNVRIVTTHHATAELRKLGFRSLYGLETWESLDVQKGEMRLRINAMPGKHGPGIIDRLLPPVMGSMLEFGDSAGSVNYRLYITGDTLAYDWLAEIPQRYPDIDLALIHLGGTRILGLLVTMDAKQGVKALQIVAPKEAIPIHYNDYTVFKSPLADFMREAERANLRTKLTYLNHGETYTYNVRTHALDGAAENIMLQPEASVGEISETDHTRRTQ